MKSSKRDNKSGGKKNSGGRDFDRRDGGRPDMFQATCAECGNPCEVPFRPTGDKPVYCSSCFDKRRNDRNDRGGDFGRPRFRDRDKRMFSAVCDKCGQKCEVPFQPTAGKPIYCEQCFSKNRAAAGGSGGGNPMQEINRKLDRIFNALVEAGIIKLPPKKEQPIMPKESIVTKAKEKKPAAKAKAAPKKAVKEKKPAKKKAAAKKKK